MIPLISLYFPYPDSSEMYRYLQLPIRFPTIFGSFAGPTVQSLSFLGKQTRLEKLIHRS